MNILAGKILIGAPYTKIYGGNKTKMVMIKCQCGSIREFPLAKLIRNKDKILKCFNCFKQEKRISKNRLDITNLRSGKLVAIKYIGLINNYKYQWECKCDCGNICYTTASNIKNNYRVSCGCNKKSINP